MKVASILWGDSWSFDRQAKNYGAEAERYGGMLSSPGTAPKPKITSPGAERSAAEVTAPGVTVGNSADTTPTGSTTTPTGTYADREGLELQLEQKRSEMQTYYDASGGKADPQVMIWYANQIHDTMQALDALPTEPVREDVLLQTLGGSYYQGDVSLGGAGAQAALGTLGLDLPADIRDISYDIRNWKSVPGWQKAADFAALLPLVGGLKYVDEAAEGTKALRRAAEAAGKHGDELVDAGGELVYNGAKQLDGIDLKPADLMEELAASGKKYTPENVLMVVKNSEGDLMWLETGHKDAGLTHILQGHRGNLVDCGIEKEDVPSVIKELLETKPKRTGRNDKGPFSVYEYNGKDILIAYGDNGYIVSMYPVKGKK